MLYSAHSSHLRQKEGIAKKLILTLCTIMISQEVDLFQWYFVGTPQQKQIQ